MSTYRNSLGSRSLATALLASSALCVCAPAMAQSVGTFTNAGFEDGTLTGWTTSGGYRPNGAGSLTTADYSGSANSVTVISNTVDPNTNAVTYALDPITGVPMVYNGNYSVRVNDSNNDYSVNAISQTVTGYTAPDLYLAWSAVMSPAHPVNEAGTFKLVVDQTLNGVTTRISDTTYDASDTSPILTSFHQVPYDPTGIYAQYGITPPSVYYSGWMVEHISTVVGADYTIQLIAADCDAGGHWGYVYLDAFASAPPPGNDGIDAGGSSGGTVTTSIPDITTPSGNTVGGLGTATTRRFDGGTLTAGDDTGSFTISHNNGIIDAHGVTSTFTGTFADDNTDTGQLIVDDSVGGGVVVLSGNNTHSGGTAVRSGATLSISSAQALGTGTLYLLGSPTVPAVLSVTGTTTITNRINVSGDPIIDVATGQTATAAGVIADDASGPGDLVKQGAGTLILGAQNTYSGGTIVDAGTLQAGVANALPVGHAVTVNAATLDLNSFNQSISTLDGSGSVALGSANLALTSAAGTFSGVISGTGSLSVTGGTETLTGTNTYTGGTTIGSGATLALGAGGQSGSIVGAIVDNGTLAVNRSDALTLSGAISGTGTLTKSGAGVLTLSGANTYSGGTTVSAGGLKGTTTSLQGAIANNAAVEFAQLVDGTYAGAMTGTGTLTKTGAGVLTLSGANTYSGGTTVSAGGLKGTTTSLQGAIVNNAAVEFAQTTDGTYTGVMSGTGTLTKTGAGALTLAGTNTYSGGTTVSAGTLKLIATSIQGNIVDNAAVELTANVAGTFGGNISGTGSLTKLGIATLTLTGTNTYSGGTTVSGGNLRGSTTAIQGSITNNAMVEFNQSTDGTYAGVMSGTGTLAKTGAGVLTLSGANTYSGGTTVSAGGLKGTTTSLQGAITNNAAVEFAQVTNGTYAGVMTGMGTLTKSGAGVLTLSGISSISGATTVSAGTLSLSGSLGTSTATVASTATLAGTGTLGGNLVVNSGGTLAPGNSPGTLTVTGNVTLNAGANFAVDIDGRTYSAAGGAGSYDRLVLSGSTSTFNAGGSISPVLRGITGSANNNFNAAYGDRFTVVTAANIGSGAFSSVVQPVTGLPTNARFDVFYNPANVQLVLTPGSYAALGRADGWLQDGINAAAGLDAVRPQAGARNGNLANLFNGLYGMSGNQLGVAFQQISGQIHADALQAEAGNIDQMRYIASDATTGLYGAGKPTLWTQLLGRSTVGSQDTNATRYTDSSYGFMTGLTFARNQDRLGLAFGYLTGRVNDTIGGRAKSTYGSMFLSGVKQVASNLSLSGTFGFAFGDTDTTRQLTLATGTSTASSHGTFSSLTGEARLNYSKEISKILTSQLFGGIKVNNVSYSAIAEVNATDSTLALSLGKGSWKSTYLTFGDNFVFAVNKRTTLNVTAAWDHALNTNPTAVRAVSMGPANWVMSSVSARKDLFNVGAEMTVLCADALSVSLGYTGTFDGKNYVSHRGNVRIGWKF